MHPRVLVTDITAIAFDQIPLVLKNKEKYYDFSSSLTSSKSASTASVSVAPSS